ncbi:MAG: 50S ribosomal protein L29 [Coriobacteriales bacterium]|jgi:large subunit ribosomal protein L29|nr:50S ribosomal protein L29 [Coriobacteriales bacterium]
MKAKDIRELSNDDLQIQLREGRTELFNLRFQTATSQLDNTDRMRQVRKHIARVLTEIRSRELGIAKVS